MKRIVGIGLLAASLAGAGVSQATEGGGGAYPNGAEDFMTGVLPPPGDYMVAYGLYQGAEDFKDGDGDTLPIEFNLEVFGGVFRAIHVTDIEVAGGQWAQHVFVPILNVDVTTPAGSDAAFGLGDVIVDPFIVGWHRPPFHWVAGVDVYLPVGVYHESDLARVGRGYWTFEPVFAATYLRESGLEVSAKFMYDINLENESSDYESGDEFHFDYAAGMALGSACKVGLSGFVYYQVTEDTAPSTTPDVGKGRQVAIGPAVQCQVGPCSVVGKWQYEFLTENRPEGEKFWLKIVCPF
jgi:hypothetical protein